MENQEQEDSRYLPDPLQCISITPQAMRFGYVFPVFVTRAVWTECITWTPTTKHVTSSEKRIYDLLDSCYKGMSKALVKQPDRVVYLFKHWFWERLRPKAKKPIKAKYGARLLLHPETNEPWLLLFDPARDNQDVLTKVAPQTEAEEAPPECPISAN